ncbi:glycosyltransferase [Mesorhizobium sp. NBSH29]|uniref:glycosyltransferase family 2 protein n=1 Tax=Mesorhizobium sp. NBSH29 TaxID=2654249 RepID=UPI00189676DE|nr:glycosyltransferase family 2 protein [Mesorhizobium sp. NBSH29]QPC88386.1 glycosyltransferase [Mesorhizobium sp. NBSH29]
MNRFHQPVSAFVISKNEVAVLAECLDSLDFCREIIIVDSGSTDGTLDLVRAYIDKGFPIRLIEQEWLGFARQKQFALDQCSEAWCLNLDCDERLDPELRAAISTMPLEDAALSAYALAGRDYLPGYGYPPAAVRAKAHVRLVRRGSARYDETRLIHEALRSAGPVHTLKAGTILHFRNLSLSEEAAKANRYATLKAEQQFARGKSSNLAKIALKPLGWFLKTYIGHRYFLCGAPGFIYAAMLAHYSFLTEAKMFRLGLGKDAPAE